MIELSYTLLKRNEVIALCGIGGTYTEEILHCEIDVIDRRNGKYDESEEIANWHEKINQLSYICCSCI